MDYRADIDGLRAIAVIAVILYHADYALFSGGYVGVDVFFVISGYLITSIIIDDLQRGRFTFTNFYQRRARRILPALFFVALFTFPASWFWLPPGELENYAESLLALLVFSSNILFFFESSYFEIASELKPLIHTWSLAVEEQFYLIYPVILLFLWNFYTNRILLAIFLIFLTSLMYAEWAALNQPAAAFYFLPARAWELLIGGMLALQKPFIQKADISETLANRMSIAGLTLIVFSVLIFDEFTPVQGFSLMLPVTGALLVIIYGDRSSTMQRMLGHRFMVSVGLISYSAYLWHQPLFVFAKTRYLDAPPSSLIAFIVVITFPLAYLTWKYIEQPFRNRTGLELGLPLRYLAVPISAIAILGVYASSRTVIENRFAEVETLMASYFDQEVDAVEDQSVCFFRDEIPQNQLTDCLNSLNGGYVVLFGDSHAAAQSYGLRETLSRRNLGLISFVFNGCPPIRDFSDYSPSVTAPCDEFSSTAYSVINDLDAEFVVVSAYWTHYLRRIYDTALLDPLNLQRTRNNFAYAIEADPDFYTEAVALMADRLGKLAANQKLVLVGPIPEANGDPNSRIRLMLMRQQQDINISTSHEEFRFVGARFDELTDQLPPNIEIVLPENLVCSVLSIGRCENIWDGKSLYKDTNHPTDNFARIIAEEIVNQMVSSSE